MSSAWARRASVAACSSRSGSARAARRTRAARARRVIVRLETPTDYDTIAAVVGAAFADEPVVVDVVTAIRASSEYRPAFSLVAEENGEIVGHVMLSGLPIEGGHALQLSPLAVRPDRQRGIGSALVEAALAAATDAGSGSFASKATRATTRASASGLPSSWASRRRPAGLSGRFRRSHSRTTTREAGRRTRRPSTSWPSRPPSSACRASNKLLLGEEREDEPDRQLLASALAESAHSRPSFKTRSADPLNARPRVH